ncbi:MAG: 4-phosphoerythronate dehydrogenase [SAR86 cluster bacterium]|uniref:Erythronate-4-phosphate dehydrogenase n=1 Tax=SAR86 cluster bacterium TaxID=2030880 RepID=A0A2A4MI18_9GAMM|nr:MAG: 4-phosphoerythronate dehydrogenase [SAR86 cluster bacterium]
MKIIVDENILSIDNYFSNDAQLIRLPGRAICNQDLRDADALLVRSITEVNEALLENTAVQFVGTATSGLNHVDINYLRSRGIGFAHAGGCNANAVVEYCITALAYLAAHKGLKMSTRKFGIIGAGNVGSALMKKLTQLGYDCLIYDPILETAANSHFNFCSFEQVLQADVISLHVPLSDASESDFPTYHLIDALALQQLKPDTVLINAARGGVVDEQALLDYLRSGKTLHTIFDVWQNEPTINALLANLIDVVTPHIAGYSQEAKHCATVTICEALNKHFSLSEVQQDFTALSDLSKVSIDTMGLSLANSASLEALSPILLQALPLNRLDAQCRDYLTRNILSEKFDIMRKSLLGRNEFAAYSIDSAVVNHSQSKALQSIGFNCS